MGDLAVARTSQYWSKPTATIVDELDGVVVDGDGDGSM